MSLYLLFVINRNIKGKEQRCESPPLEFKEKDSCTSRVYNTPQSTDVEWKRMWISIRGIETKDEGKHFEEEFYLSIVSD